MKKEKQIEESWDLVIAPSSAWFEIPFRDLWRYRDLVVTFIRRDLIVNYKQTILGPIWFIIQPLFSAIIYTIIFSKVARIPTDNLPPFLFYMSGSIIWSYFSSCLQSTSSTLIDNAGVFGKVYFPRLSIPVATVISSLGKFILNFTFFMGFVFYFLWMTEVPIQITSYAFLLPLLVLQMALFSLGCGVLISALASKYRDLNYLMHFGVQLWMYATPVVYPISQVPELWRFVYMLNPMASMIELFRLGFLGQSSVLLTEIFLSWAVSLGILFLGLIIFTRIERSFLDTV